MVISLWFNGILTGYSLQWTNIAMENEPLKQMIYIDLAL